MLIAAYVRVSSRSQKLATQRSTIERAARARGERIARWYAEKITTRNQRRPELERLKSDVRHGRIARVYVYRLDRLSRGGICETFNLVRELSQGGCQVETIGDGFSLAGPTAEIALAVLAWAAQMERAFIQERIAQARIRVEAAGGHWGRSRRCDDETVETIRTLAETRSERAIAMALKIPRSTVNAVVAEKGAYKRKVGRRTKSRVKSRAARVAK